ncbi:S9 family peptidase [Curtobacterium sp. MCLR17_032]|uniref:S9 family peptidase n=1 Tax=Curtobacterium sp. MCLR17_032 TaxID=2175650 RepID=UPI000DA91C0C|nr:S9 family peptidase [Curtobacterium sp. MCLR17_032]WIE62617.1 S9 family peptidase [Curtobacterium sp. MCLR17_032]
MTSEHDVTTPPTAAKRPRTRTHHGIDFVDDYEWLRDKESPDTIAYLEAENRYTETQTEHLGALRERLFDEVKTRVQETDLSVPVRMGQWWYFTRTSEGSQYGVQCRAPISGPDDWTPPSLEADTAGSDTAGAGAPGSASAGTLPGEEVVLDGNALAEGYDFFSLGTYDISDDGRRLVYGVDVEGDERYTLAVRDLETGQDLGDTIPNTGAGATFDPSGRYVFYPTVDDSWRPDRIWRHTVGTSADADVVVFEEPDDRYWVGVGVTRSSQYIVIALGSKITSEALVLDASDPTGEFRVVWPRRDGVEYEIEHAIVGGSDRLLVLHNDGAENFELVDVPADDPTSESDRRVVVPHHPERRIESVDAFAGHLALEYRSEALPRIAIIPIVGDGYGDAHEVPFDEALFSAGLGGNPEWDQPTLRLGYTSFVTPSEVSDLDLATGAVTVLKRQPVLGGYDPADYVQERDWATASDGTRIPISLVWRRDAVDADAPAPLHLYGYGSYEHSIDPGFSVMRLSMLDRGVVFAVAHVRGGGELGRHWYEDGKTLTKKNTFTDFVAVAEHLIDSGRTTPERLVAEGGSAGGLLMGAVANLAPERFAGILAAVPFVDALTSILDPDLPLTVIEWDEWGDPLHDPEVYRYMSEYTPYENVRDDVQYPRILAVTSINDTRVLYVEPAKWTAKLREVGAPVLLKTEMSAGHGGVSGRYDSWKERASELAWLLDVLGLADVSPAAASADPIAAG